jgi:hypothetical protein
MQLRKLRWPTRILVLNNYPFEDVWQEVRRGEKPDHHLYGINHFHRRGYEVEIVPFQSSPWLQSLDTRLRHFPIPLGSLDQQASALRRLKSGDLLYAPCQTQTHALSLARRLRLLKTPMVCIAHHPFDSGRLSVLRKPYFQQVVRGTDAYPALSEGVAKILAAVGARSMALRWGPDATYYRTTPEVGEVAVAAGRTGRDFATFARAAVMANIPAEIICLQPDAANLVSGPCLKLNIQPEQGYMNYQELLQIYSRARVLAIPLVANTSLAGLTSLMDALGMGKPVIMTRHPLIDIDIEKEGIGKWVEPGDVEGWTHALSFFHQHPEESQAMGLRARALVDNGLNSSSFADQVMDLFEQLLP